MAHQIDFSTGKAAFVFGERDGHAWHGLGTPIPADAARDPYRIAALAGAAYTVERRAVRYQLADGDLRTMDNRSVLVRMDTGAPLSVVSDARYNIVQPAEYFEAFRDSLQANDLEISAAGVLKEGATVFVTARLKDDTSVIGSNDTVGNYLCLGGGYDGTRANFGILSSIRTVCENTLSLNLSNAIKAGTLFNVPHSQMFDGKCMADAMQNARLEIRTRAAVFNALAAAPCNDAGAHTFFLDLLDMDTADYDMDGAPTSPQKRKAYAGMIASLRDAPGSRTQTAFQTWWGTVNAVTHYVDHVAPVRSKTEAGRAAARATSATFGAGAALKSKALRMAMDFVGVAA